ncbi:hypothetical protein [Alistipes timonensis]|uniref:hypothetical protein n=1 Tax=Alistipes timonensis TaxID=1465754 RepID=UPI00242F4740|nr:hypothetical protein [Alistipes timonensis]
MLTLHFNNTTLDVQESDSSYRYRSLMSKPQLVLKFSLSEFVEIPVGAWCEYQGVKYKLGSPENIKKNGTRNIEYTLTLGTLEDNMSLYKMRNPVDKRLKWSMCAKPHELVEAIVWNLNQRDGAGVWKVGECLDAAEQTVEFNHTYVDAALQDVANKFETEWEINDYTISLHKVEYFKDDPLPLAYGKGNGFEPGVGRTTQSDELPIKRLYVQGGDRNIDRSKYGSAELLLPKSQTLVYEGRIYQSDAEGYSIERIDKVSDAVKEDSLDCSEIYPSRVGTVSAVECIDAGKNFYDIIDNSIPAELNFNDYVIEGETATIIFQKGMLAGDDKQFEFKYNHSERRFELVPQEIDGVTMPNETFSPAVGDTYAIFGIMLPDSYICNNTDKTGASWDMFREAARKLYENEDQKFTFTGTLQGLWAKKNWLRVGGRLKVGGYVLFTDEQFAPDGIPIRITGIKEFLTSPYAPVLEISNSVSGKSVSSQLREIGQNEVATDNSIRNAVSYTKRRFRDVKETMAMLEDSMLDNFTNSINPLTVQTMMMLVGDESLQFRFVASKTDLTAVGDGITYDNTAKQLHIPHGFIQHMTLGIGTISSSHADSEYKVWEMNEYLSPYLDNGAKKYYLYAKVSRTDTTVKGDFLLSDRAIKMTDVAGYYHLLVGILNSEYDGERSYVSLYGFSEILPGRITTDKIVSSDGKTYFDLLLGEIGGNIKFASTDGSMKDVADLEKLIGDGNDVFTEQPIPPYKKGDLWVNGKVILKSTVSRESGEYVAADWVDAVEYDNTKTTIDGGIVTSGTIQLAGNDSTIKAGATGEGTADTSVRFWAGATKSQKTSAPFRVLQNGKLYASDVEIKGKVTATSGEFRGKVYASDGEFTGKVTATSGSFDGDIVAKNFKTIGPFQHHIESLTVSSTMGVISNFPYSFMRVTPSSNNQQLLISRSWGSKYEGRIVYIHNPHNSYNIQLVNGDYLTGSLGTFTLQPHGTIQLMWSQDSNDWIIISYYKTPDGWTA